MAISLPLINGVRYDHSSFDIKLGGVSYVGIKSLDYSHSLEPGKVFGTASQKLAETRGQYDAEASIELYRAEYDQLIAQLIAANAGLGVLEIRFNIDVNLAPEGGLSVITDNIVGCRIKKPQFNTAAGSDATAVKLDLSPMYCVINGTTPLTTFRK